MEREQLRPEQNPLVAQLVYKLRAIRTEIIAAEIRMESGDLHAAISRILAQSVPLANMVDEAEQIIRSHPAAYGRDAELRTAEEMAAKMARFRATAGDVAWRRYLECQAAAGEVIDPSYDAICKAYRMIKEIPTHAQD